MRDIAVTKDGDHYPEVCVLNLPFERAHEVAASTAVRDIPGTAVTGKNCFRIFGLKKRDRNSDRINRSGIIVPHIEAANAQHSSRYVSWKHLDLVLTRWFGS